MINKLSTWRLQQSTNCSVARLVFLPFHMGFYLKNLCQCNSIHSTFILIFAQMCLEAASLKLAAKNNGEVSLHSDGLQATRCCLSPDFAWFTPWTQDAVAG